MTLTFGTHRMVTIGACWRACRPVGGWSDEGHGPGADGDGVMLRGSKPRRSDGVMLRGSKPRRSFIVCRSPRIFFSILAVLHRSIRPSRRGTASAYFQLLRNLLNDLMAFQR
jgi:hypothetical protein